MPLHRKETKLEIRYMPAEALSFSRCKKGNARMTVENEGSYPHVLFFRCFPLDTKDMMISIRNGLDDGETEIGIINDITELSEHHRRLIEEDLAKRYFVPIIEHIYSIEELFGRYMWTVKTNKGFRELTVKNINSNVRFLGENRILVIDSDNCRYDIPDYGALDHISQNVLGKHVIL